MKMINQHYVMR